MLAERMRQCRPEWRISGAFQIRIDLREIRG
jgi:hypothetical protein